jgi:hypothetical protein
MKCRSPWKLFSHVRHLNGFSFRCRRIWTRRSYSLTNPWPHSWHKWDLFSLIPTWRFSLWDFKWAAVLNDLTQKLHVNGLSPVWTLKCAFSWLRLTKDLLHMVHGNFRVSWWIAMCVFRVPLSLNFLPHSSQSWFLELSSSMWTCLMCLFKLLGWENIFSHILHKNRGVFVSSSWDFMWFFKVLLLTNLLLQISHSTFNSPLCRSRWVFNELLKVNFLLQMLQTKSELVTILGFGSRSFSGRGFSPSDPWWIAICFSNGARFTKPRPQKGQEYFRLGLGLGAGFRSSISISVLINSRQN